GVLCLLGRASGNAGEELLQFRSGTVARDRAEYELRGARRGGMWSGFAAGNMAEGRLGAARDGVRGGVWASCVVQQRDFQEPCGASRATGFVAGFVWSARGLDAGGP